MGWKLSEWAEDAMVAEDMNEEEFCNDRGLNYEDIYEDDEEDDE